MMEKLGQGDDPLFGEIELDTEQQDDATPVSTGETEDTPPPYESIILDDGGADTDGGGDEIPNRKVRLIFSVSRVGGQTRVVFVHSISHRS